MKKRTLCKSYLLNDTYSAWCKIVEYVTDYVIPFVRTQIKKYEKLVQEHVFIHDEKPTNQFLTAFEKVASLTLETGAAIVIAAYFEHTK